MRKRPPRREPRRWRKIAPTHPTDRGATLRGVLGEAQVGKVLQRLFPAVLHDVILPDGRGGLTQIDHVALTPAGLLVVETKNYRGAVLGQAREDTWTQSLGGQRYSFQNPLRQNYLHLKAVEVLAGGAPVWGRVVFTQAARFPKGLPEGVSQVSTLRQDLAHARQGEIPPVVAQAWQALQRHARTDPAARRAHLDGLEARHGTARAAPSRGAPEPHHPVGAASAARPHAGLGHRRGSAAVLFVGLAAVIAGGLWWSQNRAPVPRVPPAIGVRSSAPALTVPRRVDVAPGRSPLLRASRLRQGQPPRRHPTSHGPIPPR